MKQTKPIVSEVVSEQVKIDVTFKTPDYVSGNLERAQADSQQEPRNLQDTYPISLTALKMMAASGTIRRV
jgi:hypothetical protein